MVRKVVSPAITSVPNELPRSPTLKKRSIAASIPSFPLPGCAHCGAPLFPFRAPTARRPPTQARAAGVESSYAEKTATVTVTHAEAASATQAAGGPGERASCKKKGGGEASGRRAPQQQSELRERPGNERLTHAQRGPRNVHKEGFSRFAARIVCFPKVSFGDKSLIPIGSRATALSSGIIFSARGDAREKTLETRQPIGKNSENSHFETQSADFLPRSQGDRAIKHLPLPKARAAHRDVPPSSHSQPEARGRAPRHLSLPHYLGPYVVTPSSCEAEEPCVAKALGPIALQPHAKKP